MTDKTFVYGDQEVVLTGREATRETTKKSRRSASNTASVHVLYEITPADHSEGSWKKWVKMSDLYMIKEEGDE